MSDHWTTLRLHNEAARHAQAVRSLREHPFALTTAERERLELSGAIKFRAPVLEFTPAPDHTLTSTAEFYLLQPRPPGFAKALAFERGLKYPSLLATIGKLRSKAASA